MAEIVLKESSNVLQIEDLATFSGGLATALDGTDDNVQIGTNRNKADKIVLIFINNDIAATTITISGVDESNQGEVNNRVLDELAADSLGICFLNEWEADALSSGKVSLSATNTTDLKCIPLYTKAKRDR